MNPISRFPHLTAISYNIGVCDFHLLYRIRLAVCARVFCVLVFDIFLKNHWSDTNVYTLFTHPSIKLTNVRWRIWISHSHWMRSKWEYIYISMETFMWLYHTVYFLYRIFETKKPKITNEIHFFTLILFLWPLLTLLVCDLLLLVIVIFHSYLFVFS